MFCRSLAFPMPAALLNQGLASNASLRKYSNRDPWNSLLPDFSVIVTTPPPDLPYSAENVLLRTFTSSVASAFGDSAGPAVPAPPVPPSGTLIERPSTMISFVTPRDPFTEKFEMVYTIGRGLFSAPL